MDRLQPRRHAAFIAGTCLAGAVALAAAPSAADAPAAEGVSLAMLAQEALPNLPGNSLTAMTVELAPRTVAPSHRHAGFVFAYVLSGEVRSRLDDGPARVYRAGESWIEPPGTVHTRSENPSRSEPAPARHLRRRGRGRADALRALIPPPFDKAHVCKQDEAWARRG